MRVVMLFQFCFNQNVLGDPFGIKMEHDAIGRKILTLQIATSFKWQIFSYSSAQLHLSCNYFKKPNLISIGFLELQNRQSMRSELFKIMIIQIVFCKRKKVRYDK